MIFPEPLREALEGWLPRVRDSELRGHHSLQVFALLGFAFCHLLLFSLLRLARRGGASALRWPLLQREAWPRHGVNRALSLLHGATSFLWACAVMAVDGGPFRAPPAPPYLGQGLSSLQRPLLLFSCSFFAYDLVYVAWERDAAGVIHHATSLAGFLYGLLAQTAGGEYTAALAVAEVSTASLHLRYFARHFAELHKRQRLLKAQEEEPAGEASDEAWKRLKDVAKCEGFERPLSYAVPAGIRLGNLKISFAFLTTLFEWSFACTFILARGVGSTVLTAACLLSPGTPFVVKVFAFTIWAVSFFWLRQVLVLVYRQLRPTEGARAAATKNEK